MLATLLAQSSLLVAPMYLGDAPPETRAVAALRFDNQPGMGEYGLAEAQDLLGDPESLASLADFAKRQAARRGWAGESGLGSPVAAFGTIPAGFFAPPIDAWLFNAEVGAVSDPIHVGEAYALAQRLERDAACRQIFVAGTDMAARAKAEAIAEELAAGADFAAIARERSEDRASAMRGGELAIFERGPDDALLREAAFRAQVGETVGPIESPLGYHLLQRVPVESIDPRLRDDTWAHARAILIAFGGAKGAAPNLEREHHEAEWIAGGLAARIRCGEDMAALARENDDDRGGRERAGDLGWVRRRTTQMPASFDRLFLEPPGDLIGPLPTDFGFVLLRREDPGPRSRIVLRKSAALELARWLDHVGGSGDPAAEAPVVADALEALAALEPAERAALESALSRCESAAGCDLACVGSNERVQAVSSALARVEPTFSLGPWREASRAIDAWRSRLMGAHAAVLDACLDDAMAALSIQDPRVVIGIHMGTYACRSGEVACVAVGEQDADSALEAVVAAALRATGPHLDEARILEQARASAARATGVRER